MIRCLFFCVALLCCGQIVAAQSTIFLVRHAEKADASTSADPKDPELSEAGRARAESLAKTLKDTNLTAIYATEFKRAQQTAEPIARAAGIKTTTVPANETASLISKLKETKGNALVVGHSNTLPDIIKALGIATPITIKDPDYDNLFMLIGGEQPRLIRLHY
jgi:broad specificity phosphatase PhoE